MTFPSLASKLFAAIAFVSLVALLLGAWLVTRAVRLELQEDVVVSGGPGSADREVTRIVRTIDGTATVDRPPAAADALDRRLLLALALVLGGTSIATILIARQIVRPLASLRAAAGQMARGDLGVRVEVRGRDEVAALGEAFNSMAARLQTNERLRRDLTNDVAHELRTPLTTLRCHLEALQDRVTGMSADTVPTLLAEVIDMQALVDDLGDLARADAGQLTLAIDRVPLRDLLTQLTNELTPRLRTASIALAIDVAAGLPDLRADRTRLMQVLRNLLDNAIRHTPAGGRIVVSAQPGESDVRIEIADTGAGIAADHLPHIFERFYRPDPSRSRETGGAGLGLAIVRQFVMAHGGTVHAESQPGRGSRFIVHWPFDTGQSKLVDAAQGTPAS